MKPYRHLVGLGRRPSPAQVLGALREAYLTGLAFLLVPGVLFGLAVRIGLGRGLDPDLPVLLAFVGVAVTCAALAWWLAARGRQQEETPLAGAFRGALQLASAPAVPFLIGCTLLGSPTALALTWGLALVLGVAGWLTLPGWAHDGARTAEAAPEESGPPRTHDVPG